MYELGTLSCMHYYFILKSLLLKKNQQIIHIIHIIHKHFKSEYNDNSFFTKYEQN